LTEEAEPGEGCRRLKDGNDGEWKVWLSMTPSNMCCGAMLDGCCRPGVPVREMGEFDLSDVPEEIFCDVRRCCVRADSVASASGWAAGRPFASDAGCAVGFSY